jgi:YggT family protein
MQGPLPQWGRIVRSGAAQTDRKAEAQMRAILDIVLLLLQLYVYIIVASVVYSYLIAFNVVSRRNQLAAAIGDALYRLTEPVYAPVRRRLPNFGAIDFTPFVVILIVILIERVIIYYIYPNVF